MKGMSVVLSGLLCAAAVSGCAVAPQESSAQPSLKHRALAVYSDPPGAHVYAGNKYWGETQQDTPIRIFWSGVQPSITCTLILKKRGYATTTEYVNLELKYRSLAEADSARDDQKIVVVLDLGDE